MHIPTFRYSEKLWRIFQSVTVKLWRIFQSITVVVVALSQKNGIYSTSTSQWAFLVINCFNNITATDSEVDWDRVEAATNTSGELAPHLVSQLLAEVHRDDFSNREYGV